MKTEKKNQNIPLKNISDNDILDFLYIDSNNIRRDKIVKNRLLKLPICYKEYLLNRYHDVLYEEKDIREIIYRIKNNIENVPLCPVCGKKCDFNGIKYNRTCSYSCNGKLNIINLETKHGIRSTLLLDSSKQKTLETIRKKYGEDINNVSQSDIIKERKIKTCLEKYNTTNPYQIEDIKNKCKNSIQINKDSITEKRRNTNLERYGYEFILQKYKGKHLPQDLIDKIKSVVNTEEYKEKRYNTLKNNKTFNTSSIEKELEKLLIDNNITFKTQYKSLLYPFCCDFYFPEKDLYLEIQGSWTHGFKPFEGTEEDNNQLKLWISKNTSYYNNAIKTWTIRDVHKREIAKQNNIKLIEIFSINIDDIKNVLKDNKIL